ncbi:MAG: M48 family metalloprotease [Armatimonadetes bacterium]|nr:M48 family metalloprotease [Armatimonadota bacterium]
MRFAWLLCLGALMCSVWGCDNPLEIDRETEIEIGREAAAEMEAEYGVVNDPVLQARLEAIGARVAAVSEEPDLPWRFRILDSDEVNAVALPGGFVYVMKGMVDFVDNETQLAGVVAHEVVHADHHHAKTVIERTMTQALLAELVLQKSSNTIRQAAGIAIDLNMREGYRDKEYEADEFGTRYAFAAGYRADGLRGLLAKLHEEKGDPARITWLLQSHPPLSRRIGRLEELIPQLTGKPVQED